MTPYKQVLRAAVFGTAVAMLAACETPTSGTTTPSVSDTGRTASAGDCFSLEPPAGASSAIADQCARSAEGVGILVEQKAAALFHAGRAELDAGNPTRAVSLIESSLRDISAESRWVPTAISSLPEGNDRDRARKAQQLAAWNSRLDRFQFGRVTTLAEAHMAVAENQRRAQLDPQPSLTAAIRLLEDQERVAQPFRGGGTVERQGEYDAFYLRRAGLYRELGGVIYADEAIEDYEVVLSSPRTQSDEVAQARTGLEAFATRLGDDALGEPGDEETAIKYYRTALIANRSSAEALIGQGKAFLGLGTRTGTADNLRQAADNFSDALSTGASGALEVAALQGRGDARDALIDADSRLDSAAKSRLLESVLQDYSRAAELSNDSGVLLRLADACDRRGNYECAARYFGEAASALQSSGTADRDVIADALLRQAQASARSGADPNAVRGTLVAAKAEDPRSALPVLTLAEFHFRNGDRQAALREVSLLTSDAATRNFDTPADAYRAEAFGLLSALNALSGNLRTAVRNADRASDLDPSNTDYRRVSCLSRVMAGWPETEASNEPRCTTGSRPNDFLLRAMYQMRRAQRFQNANSARAADIRLLARRDLDVALSEFSDGRAREAEVTDFAWPSAETPPAVRTVRVLNFLRQASFACTAPTDFELPGQRSDYDQVRQFLDFYNVRECDG